jgi:peptidoglycan-associated lipoprotein
MACREVLVLVGLSFVVACAEKPPPKEPAPAETTARPAQQGRAIKTATGLGVGEDIVKACSIQFGTVDRAPKFEYAKSDLPSEDRSVLEQVARCLTTGPLKGRAVRLVGRADPRGESEYNMTLGVHRADSVKRYLANLGVNDQKVSETSRGELDATGHDEATWQRDRRVDILLQ